MLLTVTWSWVFRSVIPRRSMPLTRSAFVKADGDNTLQLLVEKDGTASTLDVAEMVDDTYIEVEFYYDGSGSDIDAFVDGVRVGSVALTNVPDDEELTISFGVQNGEAAAKVMSVDYILAECER